MNFNVSVPRPSRLHLVGVGALEENVLDPEGRVLDGLDESVLDPEGRALGTFAETFSTPKEGY